MCVDDEILRLLTAATPRAVFLGVETALAILELEMASVAALDVDVDFDLTSPDGTMIPSGRASCALVLCEDRRLLRPIFTTAIRREEITR